MTGTRLKVSWGHSFPKTTRLLSAYGLGRIGEFLIIFNPFSSNKYVNLLDASRTILKAYATSKESFPEYYPLPLFP